MNKYKISTDKLIFNVETKSDNGKNYFVTGYITTEDRDLVNDVVTRQGMENLVDQLKSGNIKLDIEHEAFSNEGSPNIVPVGKIVEAELDEKGVWVKAVLNRDSPVFKTAWNSIKNGFIDAFSITYRAVNFINKSVNGVKTRLLNTIKILNVALTGNPVNPEASIDRVFMKSIKEEMKMTEEENKNVQESTEEVKVEEKKVETEAKTEEVVKEEATEKVEGEAETETKSMEDLKKEIKEELTIEMKSQIDALKAENKALLDKLEAPILKSPVEKKSVEVPTNAELKPENINLLNLCK